MNKASREGGGETKIENIKGRELHDFLSQTRYNLLPMMFSKNSRVLHLKTSIHTHLKQGVTGDTMGMTLKSQYKHKLI